MHRLSIYEHIQVITNVMFAYSVIVLPVHISETKVIFLLLPVRPTKTEETELNFILDIGSEMQ